MEIIECREKYNLEYNNSFYFSHLLSVLIFMFWYIQIFPDNIQTQSNQCQQCPGDPLLVLLTPLHCCLFFSFLFTENGDYLPFFSPFVLFSFHGILFMPCSMARFDYVFRDCLQNFFQLKRLLFGIISIMSEIGFPLGH